MAPVTLGQSPGVSGDVSPRPRVLTMRTKADGHLESHDSNPAPLSRELVQEVSGAPSSISTPGSAYTPPTQTLHTVSNLS